MKKIVSLILSVLLIIGCLSFTASASYGTQAARVASFELINTDTPDDVLTRGEGIYALMRLYVRSALPEIGETSVFSDVTVESGLVPYANYAYNLGFAKGIGDGRLAPDESMTLPQFVKIATSVLGYGMLAEREGGYPDGYMQVAGRIGLLKGLGEIEDTLTHKNAVILLDNMLDLKSLEPSFSEDELYISEETIGEQMMDIGDMYVVSGIVTAVGKTALAGETQLKEGEISVNSIRIKFSGNADNLLGRYVTVRYRETEKDVLPVVVSIYVNEKKNKELTLKAEDIERLSLSECVYYDENGYTESVRLDSAEVIYNGRLYTSDVLNKPQTGSVTFVDNDDDGDMEIVIIDEYVSFIVNRVLKATDTLYLNDGFTFRGKNGISFDLDDKDNHYEFALVSGEKIGFDDIETGDTVSVWADLNEEEVFVKVSKNSVYGVVSAKDEESVTVEGEKYVVYSPNCDTFMSKYTVGQKGKFGVNHNGEIVGVIGEIENNNNYGYVMGFTPASGFKPARIKILSAGISEKEVEETAGVETITYTYTNGAETIYELDDKVTIFDENGANGNKIDSSVLTDVQMNRGIVAYELNGEGKIKSLSIFTVPSYETASQDVSYSYKLNGDLNSFGGYRSNPAFYVGETTQVICVPKVDAPNEDDYGVSVPVVGGSEYTVMPVRIDSTSQIAECAVIIADMDAGAVSLFSADDDVSVVSKIKLAVDDEGAELYKLEILTDDEAKQVYIYADAALGSLAGTLKKGDLIRYDAKANGEIKNLAYLYSLSDLGSRYFINNENTQRENVFGSVTNIDLDRLDNLRNERVDTITVDINGSERTYIFPREEGPIIYSFDRKKGVISSAVPEEIQGSEQVGIGDASSVFMLVSENEPIVAVNVIE